MFLVCLFIYANGELFPSEMGGGIVFLGAAGFSLVQDPFYQWLIKRSMQAPVGPSRAESTVAGQYEGSYSAAACAINTRIRGRPHS